MRLKEVDSISLKCCVVQVVRIRCSQQTLQNIQDTCQQAADAGVTIHCPEAPLQKVKVEPESQNPEATGKQIYRDKAGRQTGKIQVNPEQVTGKKTTDTDTNTNTSGWNSWGMRHMAAGNMAKGVQRGRMSRNVHNWGRHCDKKSDQSTERLKFNTLLQRTHWIYSICFSKKSMSHLGIAVPCYTWPWHTLFTWHTLSFSHLTHILCFFLLLYKCYQIVSINVFYLVLFCVL